MSFEFNELNMHLLPEADLQYYACGRITVLKYCCLSSRVTLVGCQNYLSCRQLTCNCLSQARTWCICASKPIQSYPIEELTDYIRQAVDPSELDVLRNQLNQAIKVLDVQKEVMERTLGPQSDEEFDAVEKELNQQLEQLRRQREQRRGKGGGGHSTAE